MPTQLRPNGADDVAKATSPGSSHVMATYQQPMPDQRQAATIIEYWFTNTNTDDVTANTTTFECWTAFINSDGDYIAGVQIGPTLTVKVPALGVLGPDITVAPKLMWVDTSPQQASTYIVISPAHDFESGTYVSQSAALTTVGP